MVEERGIVWVDCGGLPGERVAGRVLERLAAAGIEAPQGGLACSAIVAEGAARFGDRSLTVVPRKEEARFLSPLPLFLLTEDDRLLALLEGAGIRSCGELANLTAEAVEVRFGREGNRVWRLSRADDPRILFRPIPPEHARASVDFVDYTVRDATRLVFTLNALLDQVCGVLRDRAQRTRAIVLTFTLAGGGSARQVLRTARPTADRTLWLRRLRDALERVELADAISGVSLEAGPTDPVSAFQGDLFDRGFATAAAVEEAAVRLLDQYRGLFVRQVNMPHALAERRVRWVELTPGEVAETGHELEPEATPSLELRILPEPRPIRVRVRARRDHVFPTHYRDRDGWLTLTAAGPDRISGGHEELRSYAREYYRCVSESGELLWIFHDAVEDRWYLHGWWE